MKGTATDRGSRRGEFLGRRARTWALGLSVVLLVPSCTFERRAEPDPIESTPEDSTHAAGAVVPIAPSVAPLETVDLFRASVAIGDISLALALLDREATLVDELVGEASEATTRGELLLELRRQHSSGLTFELLEDPTAVALSESALVFSRLGVFRQPQGGAREEVGQVYETVFLLASLEGWRIRHLHRSLTSPAPFPSAPVP